MIRFIFNERKIVRTANEIRIDGAGDGAGEPVKIVTAFILQTSLGDSTVPYQAQI